jgi:hypothetical protein
MSVLWIQTLLTQIRIRILLFALIPIWILLFYLTRIRIRLFDMDPDPCRFKEGKYLKQYRTFYTSLLDFLCRSKGPNQKAYFVKFSLPVNFVVLIRVGILWTRIRILNTREWIPDPDPGKLYGSLRIRIRNTG